MRIREASEEDDVPDSALRFFIAIAAFEARQVAEHAEARLSGERELEQDALSDQRSRWGAALSDPRFAALGSWPGREAFLAGYQRGLADAEDAGEGGTLITGGSVWLHTKCHVCGHSFREGDPVVVLREPDEPPRAVHDGPSLCCHTTVTGVPAAPPPPAGELRRRFRQQLARMYALPDGVARHVVGPGVFRIKEPYYDARKSCEQCAATFRFSEGYVRCPCGLDENCAKAVHHDPGRGLMCYSALTAVSDYRRRCGYWSAVHRGGGRG